MQAPDGTLSTSKINLDHGAGESKLRPDRRKDQRSGKSPDQIGPDHLSLKCCHGGPNHNRKRTDTNGAYELLGVYLRV